MAMSRQTAAACAGGVIMARHTPSARSGKARQGLHEALAGQLELPRGPRRRLGEPPVFGPNAGRVLTPGGEDRRPAGA